MVTLPRTHSPSLSLQGLYLFQSRHCQVSKKETVCNQLPVSESQANNVQKQNQSSVQPLQSHHDGLDQRPLQSSQAIRIRKEPRRQVQLIWSRKWLEFWTSGCHMPFKRRKAFAQVNINGCAVQEWIYGRNESAHLSVILLSSDSVSKLMLRRSREVCSTGFSKRRHDQKNPKDVAAWTVSDSHAASFSPQGTLRRSVAGSLATYGKMPSNQEAWSMNCSVEIQNMTELYWIDGMLA